MDRRTFLQTAGLALAGALTPATSAAIGEHSRVTIARLNHGGPGWDQRPTALRRLLQEVSKRTSVSVDSDYPTLSPSDRALFEHPFLTMTGSGKFDPLPDAEIDRLRTYLGAGGFLFIDSAEGIVNGSFMSSVRRMVGRVFPGEQLGEVPADHVLYKSFYLIDDPVGRLDVADDLLAIFGNDRLPLVVSQNDVLGALERDNFGSWVYDVRPGGSQQREHAFRLAINLTMYALCVNYKADQVHVPFILERRKWKVD